MGQKIEMCHSCGEQEAVFHDQCEDCRDYMLDSLSDFPEPNSYTLCDCEDRPCCGCN